MKKIIISLLLFTSLVLSANAAKLPNNVQDMVKKSFPSVDIRFDGVIILQDGTVYLPLYPSKIVNPEKLEVVTTYPEKTPISKKPDVIVFNNDYVLLRLLISPDGVKTVRNFDNPPLVIKSGLLPQDMLVPKNLVIPENLKSIAGNLNIKVEANKHIKVAPVKMEQNKKVEKRNIKKANLVSVVPQLQNKTLYVSTCYLRDIQVINGESSVAQYALAQKAIPNSMQITPDNKFLLVTNYNSTLVNIISIADDKVIKQLDLTSNAYEIVIDEKHNIAYVTAPEISTIYQISLTDMSLKKKIKVNGRCEKLTLTDDSLLYVDKLTNKIWGIELGNEYTLKDMGSYPNISKIVCTDGNIYLASRTKNRIAILDYKYQTLLSEYETVNKPIDMISYGKYLYVLSAEDNVVQVIDKKTDEPVCVVSLNTNGFSLRMYQVPNTSIAIITDAKSGKYSVMDLNKNVIIKTNTLDLPVRTLVVGKNVRKI